MEQITNALFQAASLIIVAVIGYVANRITAYFKKEGILTELKNKRAYAEIAVAAAQQMFKEADGPEKFNRAKSQLVDFLNKNKITFTEDELNVLIESAVKSMKGGISEGLKEGNENV